MDIEQIMMWDGGMYMKTLKIRGLCLLLAVALLLPSGAMALELEGVSEDAASFLYAAAPNGQVGSIGGDWTVLALARSGYPVGERYFQDYYAAAASAARAREGVLDAKKYTEHSRLVLAVSAVGGDARNVGGYDLTLPLGDFDGTVQQGINGAIWALLALDCRDYPVPVCAEGKVQASRQMYVDYILENALPDGGWNFMCDAASDAEPDMTGMALQALAGYRDQNGVQTAIDRAITRMSGMQNGDGGFTSWGAPNLEGCAQMLAALCALGISVDDARFVKNGKTLEDNLLTFYTPGKGFAHSAESTGSDLMATEQALQGLIALERAGAGQTGLYEMSDAAALARKTHPDVRVPAVQNANAGFSDVSDGEQAAVLALAARGIVGGMGDGTFCPERTMTRAQFATIVVRALGLEPKDGDGFSDVPDGQWYAAYVGTAAAYGIIHGRGDGLFDPEGTITRQEAGIMLEQAAALCGAAEIGSDLRGGGRITRGEMARAVFALLEQAGLI